jgi:D-3-phosphoglycerate dehydrogenase
MRYLHETKNSVLTPHIAGWTHESKRKIAEVLAAKIIALG